MPVRHCYFYFIFKTRKYVYETCLGKTDKESGPCGVQVNPWKFLVFAARHGASLIGKPGNSKRGNTKIFHKVVIPAYHKLVKEYGNFIPEVGKKKLIKILFFFCISLSFPFSKIVWNIASVYLLKARNGTPRTMWEICSKLTIKTTLMPMTSFWCLLLT